MAVEMHVFFRGRLPNKRELSRAMGDLGFPLSIAAGSLEKQRGFMPMKLRRDETGVEFDVFDGRAVVEEIGGKDVDPRFERSANFRWGGDEDEMLAGLCAAAALAKLVNGAVFDAEAGKLLSAEEAILLARETLHTTLKPEQARQRGTRPSDIKRYLRPLLAQRSDLVLIGRLLLIRPVRHIMRGVLLDRTSNRYRFNVWPYLLPICMAGAGNGFGYCASIGHITDIWQPHFEPLLLDTLAMDVFEPLGKIETFEDFATTSLIDSAGFCVTRLTALVLAGERDRAEAYIQDLETRKDPNNSYSQKWLQDRREFLARDIHEICKQYHGWEADAAKAVKLERVWEPSPFPVEVPAAARRSRTAEPPFIPQPWPPRPSWLFGGLPDEAGDVRFAKEARYRDGRLVLVVPLSREQAEERHDNVDDYVLSARLPNRLLLLLAWEWSIFDKSPHVGRTRRKLPANPFLSIGGDDLVVRASFSGYSVEGMLLIHSLNVSESPVERSIWGWEFFFHNSVERVRDGRGRSERTDERRLTESEIGDLTVPVPAFGDFGPLVDIVLAKLRDSGINLVS